MKIEKIADNKVKITVSFEELEKRNITLHDIEVNSTIAKDGNLTVLNKKNPCKH